MRKGFTLVEVLIAIVVMTISFFAVLAVQGSAIGGYNYARDSTEATEVARIVIENLQMTSSQWKVNGLDDPGNNYTADAYTVASTPFDPDIEPVLLTLDGAGWGEWTPLVLAPVDSRLAASAELTGGKFCVYAMGDYLENNMGQSITDASDELIGSPDFGIQIAVVYAASKSRMPENCTTFNTALLAPRPGRNVSFRVECSLYPYPTFPMKVPVGIPASSGP